MKTRTYDVARKIDGLIMVRCKIDGMRIPEGDYIALTASEANAVCAAAMFNDDYSRIDATMSAFGRGIVRMMQKD